jgi:hypothetical protein
MNLKGLVEQMRDEEDLGGGAKVATEYYFDLKGNLLREELFGYSPQGWGKPIETNYHYDDAGRLKAKVSELERCLVTYSPDGSTEITECVCATTAKVCSDRIVRHFYASGRVAEEHQTTHGLFGDPKEKSERTYRFDPKGCPEMQGERIECDESGNELRYVQEDGQESTKHSYRFDSVGWCRST